jgi:hypothetical protein
MLINSEKSFQKWLKEKWLPAIYNFYYTSIIDIIEPRDKITSGISDLLVMTSNGVSAIELKFRKTALNGKGNIFKHPPSMQQLKFLCNWGEASNGKSFIFLGVGETKDIYVFDHYVLKLWKKRRILYDDIYLSRIHRGIIGSSDFDGKEFDIVASYMNEIMKCEEN